MSVCGKNSLVRKLNRKIPAHTPKKKYGIIYVYLPKYILRLTMSIWRKIHWNLKQHAESDSAVSCLLRNQTRRCSANLFKVAQVSFFWTGTFTFICWIFSAYRLDYIFRSIDVFLRLFARFNMYRLFVFIFQCIFLCPENFQSNYKQTNYKLDHRADFSHKLDHRADFSHK